MEAISAIKLLIGKFEARDDRLASYDVWSGRYQAIQAAAPHELPACARHDFRYLNGEASSRT